MDIIFLKHQCYVCPCQMDIVKKNYKVVNNCIELDLPIKCCNTCGYKIKPTRPIIINDKPFLENIHVNVYGYCNKCLCFIEEKDIHDDIEVVKYKITNISRLIGAKCNGCI